MHSGPIRPWVRIVNTALAVALGAVVLVTCWSTMRAFDISRADLMIESAWIAGHAKKITAVTPGGVADRAGLRAGDVLEFDLNRGADWVLAGYRQMPDGFSATLRVRHADGSRAIVTITPGRAAYLPTLHSRIALLARLSGFTVSILVAIFMIWARPSLMTWSLLLAMIWSFPSEPWANVFYAFEAGLGPGITPLLVSGFESVGIWTIVFALCFPRDTLPDWARWKRTAVLGAALSSTAYSWVVGYFAITPFEPDPAGSALNVVWAFGAAPSLLVAIAALVWTYRRSDARDRARLKWALLGMSVAWGCLTIVLVLRYAWLTTVGLMPLNWVLAFNQGIVFPLCLGYAVLRQRIFDVQFAVSRTLVYGAVSTLALVFLAAVHWLLGRLIEQSGLAIGLEGVAAIGLGLVLHRASHGITLLVDRVLFRKHHQAEERLRRVTAALPFATDERSISEALVTEPVRNLELASAALFYRESGEGPLNRVLAKGWNDAHAASLEAESLLVRYLQAEHEPLKLDDSQLLPAGTPEGAALPVLAVPLVNQHVLAAVVLYGAHANHTLLDPDEIELLHQLAKAAATSRSQVRIAMLTREVAALSNENTALTRENQAQQKTIGRFEALVQTRMIGPGERT